MEQVERRRHGNPHNLHKSHLLTKNIYKIRRSKKSNIKSFFSKFFLCTTLALSTVTLSRCRDLHQPLPALSGWFIKHFEQVTKIKNLNLRSEQFSPVVLQIGAHTGFEKNDPLWKPLRKYFADCAREEIPWVWILVEPVPINFKALEDNFHGRKFPGQGKVILENCAIGLSNSNTSLVPFFTVSESIDPLTGFDSRSGKYFPDYITQIGSFKREMLLKERRVWKKLNLDVEDYIREVPVNMKSIDSIFKNYNLQFKQLTILLIDTEGFDCKIMFDLDFNRIQPAVLIYEFKHCSAEELRQVHLKLTQLYIHRRIDSENEVCFLKSQLGNVKIRK